jgi:hypothetical protein
MKLHNCEQFKATSVERENITVLAKELDVRMDEDFANIMKKLKAETIKIEQLYGERIASAVLQNVLSANFSGILFSFYQLNAIEVSRQIAETTQEVIGNLHKKNNEVNYD